MHESTNIADRFSRTRYLVIACLSTGVRTAISVQLIGIVWGTTPQM
jgi:hypothetical protein